MSTSGLRVCDGCGLDERQIPLKGLDMTPLDYCDPCMESTAAYLREVAELYEAQAGLLRDALVEIRTRYKLVKRLPLPSLVDGT